MRILILFYALCWALPNFANPLPDTIAIVKPSVVGVGTYLPTRQPRSQLHGTGFVVGDGTWVVTNAHVVANELDGQRLERRVVFVGVGNNPDLVSVQVKATDNEHDLALLKLEGKKLAPLKLGDASRVREGQEIAFTGFPIGAALGLYPATHRGIIASITPMAIPAYYSGQLDPALIKRLQEPYNVFQLDATAYPGNSGSPVFDPKTGAVVGVINKVFVKETKESVLEHPSGISYAIPVRYVQELLHKQ